MRTVTGGAAGELFQGAWLTVDAERAGAFEHATFLDENPVEMDGDRYPDGLVEGFHLVALVERLHRDLFPAEAGAGQCRAIEKIRFVTPVHAGERMRARGTVTAAEQVPEGVLRTLDTTVEVDGRDKPGFVVRWRQLWRPGSETGASTVDLAAPPSELVEVAAPFDQIPKLAGQEFRGAWLTVDPQRRRAFAFAASGAGDPVPEDRAGGPLAALHPLALLDHLVNPVLHVSDGPWFGWNYGLDDVEIHRTVRVGEPIRARGKVAAVEPRGDGWIVALDVVVESAMDREPVLQGRWRALWLPGEEQL